MVFELCAATGGRSTRVAITIAKNSKAAPKFMAAPPIDAPITSIVSCGITAERNNLRTRENASIQHV